jgi:amidohydrolase
MPAREELAGLVETITPTIVSLRHRLHSIPEQAHREFATTELVRQTVEDEGLRFQDRHPRTGGWVDLGDRPNVGFRADIDALPIVEPSDNTPRSEIDGWMHACGHDAHTAIAVGIATTLHRLRPGSRFRFVFQPGEEAHPGGAIELVSEGVVDGLDALLAFHVDPNLRVGRIGLRSGPITGSADALTVTVHGPGGHTSRPHRTVDLVNAAARVVAELPGALRRSIDARTALVTAFGAIHGGDAANVIPTEVVVKGTVRTLDPELWDVLPGLIDKSLGAILALTGAGYSIDYHQGIPPVVNDPTIVTVTRHALADELGPEAVVDTEQSMGGEDFSNYLSVTPGALLRLGAASGGGDLHSAAFAFNDEAIAFGIRAGVSSLLALADDLG